MYSMQQQKGGTQETQEATRIRPLNYCATHPEAQFIYRASEMTLTVDSDAAYQAAQRSRSRASLAFLRG